MNTEALGVKIRLMTQATDAALDLEANNPNAAEDKMFSIREDLGLLKVIAGEHSTDFKEMENIESLLKNKLLTAKNKEGKHI